ncbi:hypothetical protein C8J57DRAFT_672813 [Mycena rebaudengoi]|nr:hypothetical protein C8J57DRAFT_672813 [Mycena rebaudengoi]
MAACADMRMPSGSGVLSQDENCGNISSIPPELLATMIKLAQESSRSEDEDSDGGINQLPVEVAASHVSVYWRNVALSSRLLWCHIDVRPGESLGKLREYLARSGQCLLTVLLDLTRRPSEPNLAAKLDLLFLHLSRWRRVTIHSSQETSDIPVVSRLYDVFAPSLEHLCLCINDMDSENLKSIRRAAFEQILTQGCPRLSVLRLRGLSMHFFRPPLTNITTLYLEQTRGLFIGFHRFSNLLTASPSLAHLSIHDSIIDDMVETWPFDCHIATPNLVSLRISLPGVRPMFSEILMSLIAPKLQSLVLKEVGEAHLDRFFAVPDCASKFPALRSLTFFDFDYQSDTRIAKLCIALPSITEFTCIHSTAYPPKILRMMAGKVNSLPRLLGDLGVPWPQLHTFTTTLDIDDLELVREAMEQRQRIGCPLQRLRLSSVLDELDEDDEDDLEWLQGNMRVERFTSIDRWPPGSEYDPDDLFV